MNLGEARTRVRLLINEKSTAQWTDDEIDGLIVQANNEVYSYINAASVDYFHKKVRVAYAAETFGIVLDTATDLITSTAVGRWERILAVFKLANNAAASSTNLPQPVEAEQSIFDMWESTGQENWDIESSPRLSFRMNQRMLVVAPFLTSAVYLWVHLIPRVHEPSADAEELLSTDAGTTGELEQHHDVICLLAAIDAMISVRADYSHLSSRYADKRQTMVRALGLQQQSQSAPRVVDAHGG